MDPNLDEPMAHTPYTPLGKDNNHNKKEARQEVLEQVPLLKQQLNDFDKYIKWLRDPTTVPKEVLQSTEEFMHYTQARKWTLQFIEGQKNTLQNKIDALLSN